MRSVNVHLLTVGSRGDVDPIVALGSGLSQKGYRVTVVANSEGRVRSEQAGLRFTDLRFSVADVLRSAQGATLLESGSSGASRTALLDAAVAALPAVGPAIVAACADADAILSTETVHLLAASIAEQRGIPHIALGLVPYGRTEAYPSFYADGPEAGSLSNAQTHEAVERYHHARLLPGVNAIRERVLRLGPLDVDDAYRERERCPTVLGYSAAVLPPPADWPPHRRVTGYWRLAEPSVPVPASLAAFLDAGPAPLYVGFGSMNYRPEVVVPLLLDLTRRTGVRVVYSTGWTDAEALRDGALPETICVVPEVPHTWLLPRVFGAVHHGGAGTTAAALLAGTPSLIAWFIVDQVMWAARVAELGVGIDLGNVHRLKADALADAVERLRADPGFGERTARVRTALLAENGVEVAVDALESYLRIPLRRGRPCATEA